MFFRVARRWGSSSSPIPKLTWLAHSQLGILKPSMANWAWKNGEKSDGRKLNYSYKLYQLHSKSLKFDILWIKIDMFIPKMENKELFQTTQLAADCFTPPGQTCPWIVPRYNSLWALQPLAVAPGCPNRNHSIWTKKTWCHRFLYSGNPQKSWHLKEAWKTRDSFCISRTKIRKGIDMAHAVQHTAAEIVFLGVLGSGLEPRPSSSGANSSCDLCKLC